MSLIPAFRPSFIIRLAHFYYVSEFTFLFLVEVEASFRLSNKQATKCGIHRIWIIFSSLAALYLTIYSFYEILQGLGVFSICPPLTILGKLFKGLVTSEARQPHRSTMEHNVTLVGSFGQDDRYAKG